MKNLAPDEFVKYFIFYFERRDLTKFEHNAKRLDLLTPSSCSKIKKAVTQAIERYEASIGIKIENLDNRIAILLAFELANRLRDKIKVRDFYPSSLVSLASYSSITLRFIHSFGFLNTICPDGVFYIKEIQFPISPNLKIIEIENYNKYVIFNTLMCSATTMLILGNLYFEKLATKDSSITRKEIINLCSTTDFLGQINELIMYMTEVEKS